MPKPETKKLRLALMVLAGILLVVLLVINRRVIGDTFNLLSDIDKKFLVILPAVQLVSYFFISAYYRKFFEQFGIKIRAVRMYKMVFALNFVNQILPSGGLSGVTYLIYGLRNSVSTGRATLAQIGRYMFSYFSYFGVFAVALVFLIRDGTNVNRSIYGYLVVLAVAALFASGLVIYLISSKSRTDIIVGSIARFVDRMSRRLRSGKVVFGAKAIQNTLTDFHKGYTRLRGQWRDLWRPFLLMASSTAMEVTVVYMSFVAIGIDVNPGAVMFSFAVANAAGVVSVVPGDIGVHEAAIIAMLTLTGSPIAAAISATLLYRVYNKFLMLPLGFYFYSQQLQLVDTKHES